MKKTSSLGREEERINLRGIIDRFIRHKKLFFWIAIPIFLIIFVYQILRPYRPIYRATFDIGVLSERPVEGFFDQYQETPVVQIGAVTQRVISNILSINLAERVVDTLSLGTHVRDGKSDIDVVARIKADFQKPIGPMRLSIRGNRFEISHNGEKAKGGPLDEYVDMGMYEIKVTALTKTAQSKTYELTVYPRNKMALALRNSLAIKVLEADQIGQDIGASGVPFSGEGSSEKLVTAGGSIFPGMSLIGIVRINVNWGNPDDALRIAQVLSELIIAQDISEKSLEFIQSQTFIDSQLTLYENELTVLEEKVRRFKEQKKIADLEASTQALITQISSLESRKNQLQIEQKMLGDLSYYLAQDQEDIADMPSFASVVVADPVLQNFYADLLDVAAELRGRLKEYSGGHPKVLEVRARLDGLKEQLRVETEKRTSTIKSEISSVDNQIMSLQARLSNVPDDEIQLARLERDKETAEKLYTFFAEKLEETRVQEAGVTSDLRMINPPLVLPKPTNSRGTVVAIFFGIVISIFAGTMAVLVTDYMDNTIKDPDAVSSRMGIAVYASIPLIGNEENGAEKKAGFATKLMNWGSNIKRTGKKADSVVRIIDGDISTPEFEAFRKLSTNIDFAHPEKEYRVIYVSSSGPEEGKTFVTLNFGVALGMMNKKVVLLDTDFRKKRGNLTDIADKQKAAGLFDVLEDRASLADVMTTLNLLELHRSGRSRSEKAKQTPATAEQTALANATVELLPVGAIPPNPFVFLESDRMQRLVRQLKVQYDYVIVDGVPVLLFADAAYLANFADGVLLTARYGRTDSNELRKTMETLLAANSRIIGIAMNGVPKDRGSYYYHYYHKYYSKYYRKSA